MRRSEYLFLLTILIKPLSGFKIAFSMLDQDGNGWIDKVWPLGSRGELC